MTDAISPAEFAALMAPLGPFAGDRRIGVAVSGGADSMALVVLLRRWGRPFACVVDHGLRPESAEEAGLTMRRLAGLGVPARLLRAHLSQGPSLAVRARTARYALLEAACRHAGLADLVLGHHGRDQAETLLLRRAAGSGGSGLSAMAAIVHADAVRLLRPLLTMQPSRLRATLQSAGVGWVEDPSNVNLATPRARLRAGPLSDPAETARLGAEALVHGAARSAVEVRAALELSAHAEIHPCGVAHVRACLGPQVLSALVWALSGATHPPPSDGVARLVGSMRASTSYDGTLHGARVLPAGRLGPGWLLGREAAAMEPAVSLDRYWDGRFQAAPGRDTMHGVTLGPLGPDAAQLRRCSALPSALLQTLPTLRRNGAIVAVPHLCYPDAAACRSALVWFRPARPIAPAAFVTA